MNRLSKIAHAVLCATYRTSCAVALLFWAVMVLSFATNMFLRATDIGGCLFDEDVYCPDKPLLSNLASLWILGLFVLGVAVAEPEYMTSVRAWLLVAAYSLGPIATLVSLIGLVFRRFSDYFFPRRL